MKTKEKLKDIKNRIVEYGERNNLIDEDIAYAMTLIDEASKLSSQQKQEMVGEVEKEIRLQSIWFDGSDTEYGMGWNGCLEQLNKQLKQRLTK